MTTRTPKRPLSNRVTYRCWPALAALLLFACSSDGTDSASKSPSRVTITVAYANGIRTLDPQHANYAMTNMVDSTVYEPLVTFDGSKSVVGVLARSFQVSPDATSIDVTLDGRATFHDGSPLTATDVKYSLDRYVTIGHDVADLLASYQSTTVVDPTHLTIHLSKPDVVFLGALNKAFVMKASLVEANAGSDHGQTWLETHDAGSGPFVTNGRPVTEDITVTRYDDYWQFDPARPAAIVFRRVDQNAAQLAQLMAGDVDIAQNLKPADAATLATSSTLSAAYLEVVSQTEISFNNSAGPTANVAVRKALQLAYDYQRGLDTIHGGKGTIANGVVHSPLPCRVESPPYTQNLDEARRILVAAGIADLTLTMRFQPTNPIQTAEAEMFKSNLEAIGVTLELVPIAYADYLDLLKDPATIPQMMLQNDYALVPDTGAVLLEGFGSRSIGTNHTAYANPTVDALLSQAQATTNADDRCALYKQVQTIVYNDAPQATLYQVDSIVGYRSGLQGVVESSTVNPIALAGIRV